MATARTKCISTKVTNDEYSRFTKVARGETVSGWARGVLIAAASAEPSLEHIVLAEVLALRTILLNLHFALASGQTPTTGSMQHLIECADQDKIHKAYEHLGAASRRRYP